MDRVGEFLREKTPRRFLSLAAFLLVVVLFRRMLLLLVFFVAFERSMHAASRFLMRYFRCSRKAALLGLVTVAVGGSVLASVLSAGRIARAIVNARHTFPERVAAVRENTLYLQIQEHLPGTERILEVAKHYSAEGLRMLSEFGHLVVSATIALALAVVFLLEEEEFTAFKGSFDRLSLTGTLIRWFEYLVEAISVTVQLQVIVAGCNTLITLPVLLALGVHHIVPLMVLIFISALIPIVGNIVSGVVLSLLAFYSRGWLGVGVIVALTLALHKVEAFYLTPRLTAQHVKLPGLVLTISLLAWEQLLGFSGVFISFPFLFVVEKIHTELKREDLEDKKEKGRIVA